MAVKSLKYLALFAGHIVPAAPLSAQTNGTPDSPAGEANPGQVDLNNFSLPGRVTRPADRPAEPAPAPRQTEPAATRPAPTETPTTTAPRAAPPTDTPARSAATTPTTATPSSPVPDLATDSRPSAATPPASAPSARTPLPSPVVLPPEADKGWSFLPFLAGLLGVAGLGVIAWFVRQRRASAAYAGAPAIDLVSPRQAAPTPQPAPAPASAPRPDPVPPAPVATPAPMPAAPTAPVGIVSSSLRPWLEVELTPDKALIDDNGAAIAVNVTLFNSGAAPARDVSIEACLLNAGALQDQDLGEFYAKPRPDTDTIPLIPPQSRIPLRTAVRLNRDAIREYEVEGRKIFAPMVAVSTRYRWSSGEGQTGSSFLVGRGQADEDRLGPLRVDQGNRTWNGLAAKRYEKGLRN